MKRRILPASIALALVLGCAMRVERTLLPDSTHSVSIDSVAIFETNVARNSPTVGALAIATDDQPQEVAI